MPNGETRNHTFESHTRAEKNVFNGDPSWRHAQISVPVNAADLSQTPLGRALLHAACLWRHPAGARFFFKGLTRNLREWSVQHVHR